MAVTQGCPHGHVQLFRRSCCETRHVYWGSRNGYFLVQTAQSVKATAALRSQSPPPKPQGGVVHASTPGTRWPVPDALACCSATQPEAGGKF